MYSHATESVLGSQVGSIFPLIWQRPLEATREFGEVEPEGS